MPIAFEVARRAAAQCGWPLDDERNRESDSWWFFGVRQIGSFGIVVAKRDGATFTLGSRWTIDDWLWAYDRGLRDESAFVVTAVRDVEPTVEALVALRVVNDRWWTRRHLEKLPVSYKVLPDLPKLRALQEAPFEWEFR